MLVNVFVAACFCIFGYVGISCISYDSLHVSFYSMLLSVPRLCMLFFSNSILFLSFVITATELVSQLEVFQSPAAPCHDDVSSQFLRVELILVLGGSLQQT